MSRQLTISFIGGGNMASALIGGMLERGFAAAQIRVVDPSIETCARLHGRFGVHAAVEMDRRVLDATVLVLAVKPQQMKEALTPLAGQLAHQLIISIAAGLRIQDMSRWLGGYTRIVRAMPNTPALIGAGVTGLYADESVDAPLREAATKILSSVGSVVWVDDEARIDGITAISGSGPAYVFYFLEALESAAQGQGFDEATARRLAIDTVLGAVRLAAASSEAPGILRDRVTSKGGTTAAALDSMAESGVFNAIVRAVVAAAQRAKVMGDKLGKG